LHRRVGRHRGTSGRLPAIRLLVEGERSAAEVIEGDFTVAVTPAFRALRVVPRGGVLGGEGVELVPFPRERGRPPRTSGGAAEIDVSVAAVVELGAARHVEGVVRRSIAEGLSELRRETGGALGELAVHQGELRGEIRERTSGLREGRRQIGEAAPD